MRAIPLCEGVKGDGGRKCHGGLRIEQLSGAGTADYLSCSLTHMGSSHSLLGLENVPTPILGPLPLTLLSIPQQLSFTSRVPPQYVFLLYLWPLPKAGLTLQAWAKADGFS